MTFINLTYVKCPNCKNSVEYEVVFRKIRKSEVTGKTYHEKIKYASHKKGGILSLKCPNSGAVVDRYVFKQSEKVDKIKCKFCKKSVWAFKLSDRIWDTDSNKDVGWRHYLTVHKLFTHTNHYSKCFGSGKIVKHKNIEPMDNNHP